jgi:hypothetical protein
LKRAFCCTISRRQRRSDGTISLAGQRFEIPNRYRHLEQPRVLAPANTSRPTAEPPTSGELPPLLRKLLADYAATGRPPGYLPKPE